MDQGVREFATNYGDLEVSATVDPIGAALLSAKVGGVEIIQPPGKDLEKRSKFFVGSTLFPWCNRTRNGTWLDPNGKIQHLPINEPTNNNALHGFVAQRDFTVVPLEESGLAFETAIGPEAGYFFQLGLRVSYRLEPTGIRCEYMVHNFGKNRAPFALAAHPYFKIGGADTGELLLRSQATHVYKQDSQQIPIGMIATSGTRFDLRLGRRVRDLRFDDYFTGIEAASDGKRHTYLESPEFLLDIWQDPDFKHLVIFSTQEFEGPTGNTAAIAIEPSTSAVNALNSEEDLLWLEPDKGWTAEWGVRLIGKSVAVEGAKS